MLTLRNVANFFLALEQQVKSCLRRTEVKFSKRLPEKKLSWNFFFHWNLRDQQHELNPSVDGLEIYIQPLAVI